MAFAVRLQFLVVAVPAGSMNSSGASTNGPPAAMPGKSASRWPATAGSAISDDWGKTQPTKIPMIHSCIRYWTVNSPRNRRAVNGLNSRSGKLNAGKPAQPADNTPTGVNEPPRSDKPSAVPLQLETPGGGTGVGVSIVSAPADDPNAVVKAVLTD